MMKNIIISLVIVLLAITGVTVYLAKNNVPVPEPKPIINNSEKATSTITTDVKISTTTESVGSTPGGIKNVITANNQFALDYYAQLKNSPDNIFFSPYSISTALSMVYEGAKGETADEIFRTLRFPTQIYCVRAPCPNETAETSLIRRASTAAVYNDLNKSDAKYSLSVANALWAESDYKFLPEYFATINKYYAGGVTNLDFKNAAEQARLTINKWVESRTNNKIKNLFPPGTIDDSTRLVLTNAVYFKGTWVKPFEKKQTADENFNVSSVKIVKVPTMKQVGENNMYTETAEVQVLQLPYEGNKLAMTIILPKTKDLAMFEKSLSAESLKNIASSLRSEKVNIYIPKFTLNTKYIMNDSLAKMGMPSVFNPSQADLSGMDGSKDLSVSLVVHQAFVDVYEEGTEAAAATGVSVGLTSVMPNPALPKEFRADHPFIFMIQDITNDNILFIGRVVNPSE